MKLSEEHQGNRKALQATGDGSALEARRNNASAVDKERRPIVVVLGMHRSGTSLCAHILSMLGVDMADEVGVNLGNQKGHWERWEIVGLQDEILALLNRVYYSPQHDFPLPAAWLAEPEVRAVQTRIENFLSEKLKTKSLFGFKDPRTARLLPMWLRIFKNLDLAPRFVLCLREPSQIARSLHQRDGLDPAAGEYRALNYLADCFRYIPRHDLCIVNYEEWFGDYSDNLNGLMNFLDIEWEQSQADLAASMEAIVEPELRHSDERLGVARQPLVRSFYNLVAASRKDPARRADIDHFVNQFVAFQQLLWPFERAQRALSGAAARVPELEGGLARLEAARAEQASAAERLAASEARLADLAVVRENADAAGRQREQGLNDALVARAGELEMARTEQASAVERLAASESRLAELVAAFENADVVGRQREQTLNDALAARTRELEMARLEQASAAERLATSEARVAELGAVVEAESAASAERQQALIESLAAREGELAAAAAEHADVQDRLSESEAKLAERLATSEARVAELGDIVEAESAASAERQQALIESLAAREGELAAAAAEHADVQDRLSESEATLAERDAAARAEQADGRQRERALSDALIERDRELENIRAAFGAAQERFLQLSDLAVQLPERDATIAALHAEAAAGQQRGQALRADLDTMGATLSATKRREESLIRARASLESELGLSRAEAAAATDSLAQRDRDLEAVREVLSATHARAQTSEAARAELENGLSDAHAERVATLERLNRSEAQLSELQVTLEANDAAARQREHTLEEARAAAKTILEAQVRALRDKLADTEAALARSTAMEAGQRSGDNGKPPRFGGSELERVLVESGLFDVDWYRKEYKDAASSGLSPVLHFLQRGYLRGYQPNPLFDTRWYLERNEDVRRSGENPLIHYILTGFREGRDPGPGFQTRFYMESNPEVRDSGINPLAHYLLHGRQAGKLPLRHS